MASNKRFAFLATMIGAAITVVMAQQPTPPGAPARDQQRIPKSTVVLRGTVVDAQTAAPVRRANVEAVGPGARGESVTDGNGRFEVRDLVAGKYTVSASRMGYLRGTLGQRRIDGPGVPLEVADGRIIDQIVVRLTRGGVISGRVLDEFGDPAIAIDVQVHQYRFASGARRLSAVFVPGGSFRTDDTGAFRLYGLAPGQYYVSARPVGGPVRMNAVAQTDLPTVTYFPNGLDPGSAQRVIVEAGRETPGVNITLMSGRLSRVRGRAVMSTGEPFVGSTINFSTRDESGGGFSMSSGLVGSDGGFEVNGVMPGRYLLTVRPSNAGEDEDVEVGRTWLTVTGDDVQDAVLVGARGAIARGAVVTDEATPFPFSPNEILIHALPTEEAERTTRIRPVAPRDDFSFELKGLFGRHQLSTSLISPDAAGAVPGGAAAWGQKAVFWRGEDVSEKPFNFEPGQTVDGIEIVFSRRWSELSGTVTDDRGNVVGDTWLILFPADSGQWTAGSRYVRATRANPEGVYRFQRLLPHNGYLMAAVPDVEPGQWLDPEFLRSIRDFATRLSVADGTAQVQNVTIARH
jgi:hypothetical protein